MTQQRAAEANKAALEAEKAKPDKWGCVQARELWSPQEERQVRPDTSGC